jgi:spoIIIJ-associated protein
MLPEPEKIKSELEEFFKKTNLEVEVEISLKDSTYFVNLKTEEPQILLGEEGSFLLQLQKFLKVFLRKKLKIEEEFHLDLDVGGYKAKKIEYLKELARTVADEVALTKKAKVLKPMSAFERRVIHLELASRGDVLTESIGEEPNRKVVIKPYP